MKYKKDAIVESDLVLIHIEEKPAFYGRVEHITVDVKPKWWRVKFVFLTFPVQVTTWILDDDQIRGADFTMGGTPIRIEKLVVPDETEAGQDEPEDESDDNDAPRKKARVLSLGNKDSK